MQLPPVLAGHAQDGRHGAHDEPVQAEADQGMVAHVHQDGKRRDDVAGTYILGGVVTCSEGFEIFFLKVSLPCLGSMAAAVQPNNLGTLRKHFTKPSEQVAAPPGSAASTDWRGAGDFQDGAEQGDNDRDPHCDAGYPSSDFKVVLLL